MSYQALYRVYRPQTFSELIGQDAISQTLLNALRQNRLAHAYLFCGPRGTGKTSTSKILADTLAVRWPHPVHFNCELEAEEHQEPSIDLTSAIHQVFGEDVPIEIH